MSELPRLNGIVRALEQGQAAFAAFSPAEVDAALAMGASKYDGVVFEMEHNPWDARALLGIRSSSCSTGARSRKQARWHRR